MQKSILIKIKSILINYFIEVKIDITIEQQKIRDQFNNNKFEINN